MSITPSTKPLDSDQEHAGSPRIEDTSRRTIRCFASGDTRDPYNWSPVKKIAIVFLVLNTVLNSTISSALPSGNPAAVSSALHIASPAQLVLLTSIYLLGYVFGPLAFGPLSEIYGRKTILLPTFFAFMVFTLGCALSRNWASLVVLRLLTGIVASAPITIVGGVYADIFADAINRGRAMAAFMAGNTFGPILGPVIAGFAGELGWRWPFWVALILASVSWLLLLLLPESYAPVLINRETESMCKHMAKESVAVSPYLQDRNTKEIIRGILVRPLRLLLQEPIVFWVCFYLALAFGVFYLFFEAYPIIFQGIYGMAPGISALALLPIGVGAVLACGIFFYYDNIIVRAEKANKPWTQTIENRRLPLACLGGPILGSSLFWLSWTANAKIHPIVPILAGLPFGIGFLLIFMALTNYLTDLYTSQAASVMATATCTRSIFGAALPFAAESLYRKLGVHWAGNLLGFLALGLGMVPWIFMKWGHKIRKRSPEEGHP